MYSLMVGLLPSALAETAAVAAFMSHPFLRFPLETDDDIVDTGETELHGNISKQLFPAVPMRYIH